MNTATYVSELEETFRWAANAERATAQSAYMRNRFPFFGIMAKERKDLLRPFFARENRPAKSELPQVVKALWRKPEREFHYSALELCAKFLKQSEEADIKLFEHLLTTHSWWDTVDFTASTLVGNYFRQHPETTQPTVKRWLHSENMWLQRSTLIFQLKYKKQVDSDMLADNIHALLGTQEFFINKAIGWALREYGKVNPDWVVDFVGNTELSGLSRREALKHLGKV